MKSNKILFGLLTCLAISSCSDMNEMVPQGAGLTSDQMKEANENVPSRSEATIAGMYSMMGMPDYTLDQGRADDFGYIMNAISMDLEASDMCIANSGYNWFSVCGEYTSRFANYANPYIRYASTYNQIKVANEIIASFPADVETADGKAKVGQAKAMRAFDYLSLAPYFQFNYATAKDELCVPLVTENTQDYANNPRATVGQVYEQIINDLDDAIELLADYDRGGDKARINQQVAYGLRARAHLNMGMYAEAAEDAIKAMEGYTPASITDISTPSFCQLSEANWIWGINIDASMVLSSGYPTASSWVSAFSGDGYAAACQCVPFINNLLYEKIPATDARKHWWLDENSYSPLLETIDWNGNTGIAISNYEIENLKMKFLPYYNVKFGMKSGIGSEINNNDWCLMRAEEMILIQAEGLAMSGREEDAKALLENFVKQYRDPAYTVSDVRSLQDEIWMQRRIELWGEGFAMNDIMRLGKPVVRFHADKDSNYPEAFRFNLAPTDGWLLLRFPQSETNTNLGIVDNKDGVQPVQDQNGDLRDGVTD